MRTHTDIFLSILAPRENHPSNISDICITLKFQSYLCPGLPATLEHWLPLLPVHVPRLLKHAGQGRGQPEGLQEHLLCQAGISRIQELEQGQCRSFPEAGGRWTFASTRFEGMGSRAGCESTHPFQESVGQGLNQEAGVDEGCTDATGRRGEEGGGGGEEETEKRVWDQLRSTERSSSDSKQQSYDEKRLWSVQPGYGWWPSSARSKKVSDSPAW